MIRFRNVAGFLVSILALAQSSCVESEQPLTELAKCKVDKQLLGTWATIRDDGKSGTRLEWRLPRPKEIANCPAGLMFLSIGDSKGGPVFATSVGKDKYLQLLRGFAGAVTTDDWDKILVKDHIFFKYAVAQDKMTVWFMDMERTAKAVKARELRGVETIRLFEHNVVLSGSTEDLVKFLQNGGNKTLFPGQGISLKRVKK